ncbi:hypothetical protein LJC23_02505 [Desulfovibrio sp. OttesenSCG-928-I05]|nr:hypothetical protein [Desulfovibrio sp. OttesenSCG-928-I05]
MRKRVLFGVLLAFCLGLMTSGCAWMDKDPSRPMTDVAAAETVMENV